MIKRIQRDSSQNWSKFEDLEKDQQNSKVITVKLKVVKIEDLDDSKKIKTEKVK